MRNCVEMYIIFYKKSGATSAPMASPVITGAVRMSVAQLCTETTVAHDLIISQQQKT